MAIDTPAEPELQSQQQQPQEESVEILLEMARNGEIDPWNIDIIDIVDRFLRKIEEREKIDLRVSARTLLYASIM
ncbi:MAG TPA: segregation/condensation protein A, partial [Methanocella sp.]|nr:segregation/condensation protein A [Methanocella sp.]